MEGIEVVPISFPIPLASAPTLHYVTKEEVELATAPAECPGSAEEPKAEKGNLCIYEFKFENAKASFILQPIPTLGANLVIVVKAGGGGDGSFAVTAE